MDVRAIKFSREVLRNMSVQEFVCTLATFIDVYADKNDYHNLQLVDVIHDMMHTVHGEEEN